MTDNEIIKTLEDIVKENEFEYYHSNTMSWYADIKSALGLIKRQRAELERFKKIEATVNSFWEEIQKLATFKGKEAPTLEELLEHIEQVKTEAVKEFENRFKQKVLTTCKDVSVSSPYTFKLLDNTKEEMVGEG